MSHCRASVRPSPSACPLTAAITGLLRCTRAPRGRAETGRRRLSCSPIAPHRIVALVSYRVHLGSSGACTLARTAKSKVTASSRPAERRDAPPPPAPVSEIWPGKAYPLGATYDGSGTNFAVFSEAADSVDLCLFDADGAKPEWCCPRLTVSCGPAHTQRGARPTLRLPGARAVRTERGPPAYLNKAAAGPVCEGHRAAPSNRTQSLFGYYLR